MHNFATFGSVRDAQRYDLDPDPRSRSPGPESCKINHIT